MTPKGPKNPERSFGLSVGTVLLLIAGFALWRNRITVAEWTGAVGAVLVVCGALAPSGSITPARRGGALRWRSDGSTLASS